MLEIIREDEMNSKQRTEAVVLTGIMESFNFVFMLHCLISILAVTNVLTEALQRKDQEIENAMSLLKTSKERFKLMRENDWESLFEEVSSFCFKHDIDILNMDDEYKLRGRSRRKSQRITTYTIFVMNCLTISFTCNLLSWMIVLLRRVWSYFFLWQV